MKYGLKTAIRIVREEDRQELIPFFEHIKSDCNNLKWALIDIKIGEIWLITDYGNLMDYDGQKGINVNDYTIIQGIPENWRDEMENEPELQSKINQLEAENKEFRECLSEIYKELELWVEGEKQFTSNSKALITQAKQLLNK